ncbi:FAD-binding oxidoreductase [Pseudomaricurvus alkylphenolicus]|uniref:NAD(P)-binding protein n=1 Tax=Pseudomaricurvus alkylphenolicus TaxID=1306991 RepID=UPI00142269D7|nr:NAD(P)-binding protein [Pseudomaricurvus alkylphenolicus]NIB40455.1 FAD-binding oxidoreductase [Pseudomaricurvus alkylphenolicus]
MSESKLGMNTAITRRDFTSGVLKGSGAALLAGATAGVSTHARSQGLDNQWTGPGGVGDYARSNGNTHEVVNGAHSIRDGLWKDIPAKMMDSGEEYDLVIVGGGFAGLMTAFTYLKEGKGKVLMVENHPIFGGEGKQNEMVVDGYHLHAPQGSNGTLWPPEEAEKAGFFYHPVWFDLGLPGKNSPNALKFEYKASGTDKPLKFTEDNYDAMQLFKHTATLGYYYKDKNGKGSWAINPWDNGFRDAPISERAKQEMLALENYKGASARKHWEQWLDSMTYKEFITNEVGVGDPHVLNYLNPMMAAHGPGLGTDVISALGALSFGMPGVSDVPRANGHSNPLGDYDLNLVSFPGGNAAIARHFVKKMIPDSIEGQDNLHDIVYGNINWSSLDRKGQDLRIRVNSTAVSVEHEGPAESADSVNVTYIDNATHTPTRIKAKHVVMAGGQWINKHVIRDAPEDLRWAMGEFFHAPMLVMNLAVRNWRFMERLGITAARWFEGFGWFTNVRAPMNIDGRHMPLDPDLPTTLTFYNTFTDEVSDKGLPIQAQGSIARASLFSMSYRDIEYRLRKQMTEMFGPYGFDAKKDIAGLITNRWGHAYVAPQPGFFFGKDGRPAPRDVVREGYGRVRFAHSELSGEQLWTNACHEGERAAKQILAMS